MKKHILTIIAAFFLAHGHGADRVRVIFDTDMGNDIDDAMALVILNQLVHRGSVDLLAVTSTKDHPLSAPYIDALNTYYGNPDIPIGAVRNGATPEKGRYNEVAKRKGDDGKPLYPHDLESGEDAPEAVSLLRKTLAAQPDKSVILLQVGFFTNLARLLESKPDDHSPLNGKDLILKKVKRTLIMAGAFQRIDYRTMHLEYNVVKDIPSAKKMARDWPGELVWSGFEIGINSRYPWYSIMEDYEYLPNHLIKDSYLAYILEKPHDRPTWDLSVVMHGVFPERKYFEDSPAGNVTVDDKGRTDFKPDKNGNDRFMIMSPAQAARIREAYVQLCSQPPVK